MNMKYFSQTIQQQMNGFIIPRWGGVTIINTEKPSDEDLNNDDFQRFVINYRFTKHPTSSIFFKIFVPNLASILLMYVLAK